MSKGKYSFTVFFEPLEEGGYAVVVPALPEVITYGRTLKEARQMAQDAIRCHCEGLLKDGQTIPTGKNIKHEPVREELSVLVGA